MPAETKAIGKGLKGAHLENSGYRPFSLETKRRSRVFQVSSCICGLSSFSYREMRSSHLTSLT